MAEKIKQVPASLSLRQLCDQIYIGDKNVNSVFLIQWLIQSKILLSIHDMCVLIFPTTGFVFILCVGLVGNAIAISLQKV